MKLSPGEKSFDWMNVLLLFLLCVIVVLPIAHVVAGSLSSSGALTHGTIYFWPKDWTPDNFRRVASDSDFWISFRNTLFVVTAGTTVNLAFTFTTAYPLSKSYLKGRKVFLLIIVFTLIFNAPMIPAYLLVKQLGLLNTFWALVLPVAISPFYLILCVTFLRTLPEELFEAARMDGMKENSVLWRIAVPLSKPVLVTLLLFYAVGHWNSYMTALLYITDRSLHPLQVYLYRIIAQSDTSSLTNITAYDSVMNVNPVSIQMAAVVLAALPIVVLYPFLQKHFIKGAMLGSIKE